MKSHTFAFIVFLLVVFQYCIMSDTNSNKYASYLYHESAAEELKAAQHTAFISQVSSAVASIAMFTTMGIKKRGSNFTGRVAGSKTKKRKRLDVDQYIVEMDLTFFCRKYRMSKNSFYNLLDIIKPHLPTYGSQRSRGANPNGTITAEARLSMALRYCAGGNPLDISDIHGINKDMITDCLWDVIDAIHRSPKLNISFPECKKEQEKIAEGFKCKSDIDIDCCVGAIDGILIWINKPSSSDEKVIKFGGGKFFCGRKKKFGLNMQGVCDSRGSFLDVYIQFPGSALDFCVFDESDLKKKLEKKGFLRAGYCLCGDNAYLQAPYMRTPFRNAHAINNLTLTN